jgi:hypothetical protein
MAGKYSTPSDPNNSFLRKTQLMTFIRMMDGRDRGHVKEMPFDDAQAMLSNGQAVLVNFNEPDPLGYREMPEKSQECDFKVTVPQKPAGGSEPSAQPVEAASASRSGPASRFRKASR